VRRTRSSAGSSPIPKTADGHYDRDRLDLAIRHGFRVVRWTPDDAAAREVVIG
jgi:hypothetical protein